VSLGGLLLLLAVLVIVGIFGMKLIPSYMEFGKAKTAIEAIAREKQGGTVAEIRKAFDARATIDDISAIKATDLDITKEGNQVVISFAYRREIPLFSNLGVYIDFAATSKDQ
jgi:ABC-type Na+ efflux pump permease subunit